MVCKLTTTLFMKIKAPTAHHATDGNTELTNSPRVLSVKDVPKIQQQFCLTIKYGAYLKANRRNTGWKKDKSRLLLWW